MKRLTVLTVAIFGVLAGAQALTEGLIVYTAHQDWLSRIYLLHMDGSVQDYFEYDFTRFSDMEVVNNELYVAESFAPRVYKVNLETGDLEVFIDDWSLYYFYGIGFDGAYFYLDEWDMNRYDITGQKDGTASFDGMVYGSAWDGSYLWTLSDEGEINPWDLSGWPTISPALVPAIIPPTPECRGLWHDGVYFWTAESKEGLGQIYRFDSSGQIIDQWLEPAFRGWSACVIRAPSSGVAARPVPQGQQPRLELSCSCPLRTAGTIRFVLPAPGPTDLTLYNQSGEVVTTLLSADLSAGGHQVRWSPGRLPNGYYFFQLRAAGLTTSARALLTR